MKMKKKEFKASPRLEDWRNKIHPDDLELIERTTRYKRKKKNEKSVYTSKDVKRL